MKSPHYFQAALLAVVAIAALAALGYTVGYTDFSKRLVPPKQKVTNFQECAAAGNAIMESYPRQCRHNGELFVEKTQTPPTAAGCVVGGCSGEVCSDASGGPVASNCMYKPEFACFKTATCERQTNGQCGWTQTVALKACIANPPELE